MKKVAVFSRSGIFLGNRYTTWRDKLFLFALSSFIVIFILVMSALGAYYMGTGKIPFITPDAQPF